MRTLLKWLTGPIQSEAQASEALRNVGIGWYAMAAMMAFFGLLYHFRSRSPGLSCLPDAFLYAAAGFLLPRRRSRFFAVFMLFFSLSVVATTIAARWGASKDNGQNVLLAIIGLLLAYRGVHATIVYHRSVGSVILWKNVTIVGSLCVAASVAIFIASAIVSLKLPDSEEAVSAWAFVLLVGSWAACHFALRRRFPWVRWGVTASESTPA